MFLWCICYIPIKDICEHVNLDATIQYNGIFSIQFCSNRNLTSPLIWIIIKFPLKKLLFSGYFNLNDTIYFLNSFITFSSGLPLKHMVHLCRSGPPREGWEQHIQGEGGYSFWNHLYSLYRIQKYWLLKSDINSFRESPHRFISVCCIW